MSETIHVDECFYKAFEAAVYAAKSAITEPNEKRVFCQDLLASLDRTELVLKETYNYFVDRCYEELGVK
jgi:hypothetical protein